jgi:uncharacterized linocin/CFP29 family protein
MTEGNDQVGWTDAQWNRVREEVQQAWQRVRVAGSFLPVYGPLPPSTQVVPSEIFNRNGTVDDQATANLLEIALPVMLSRQQLREEDLSDALLQFRRRAAQVGQLEDWYIFNGTYPRAGFKIDKKKRAGATRNDYRPDTSFLDNLVPPTFPFLSGTPKPIADAATQISGLRRRNPGALGLLAGSAKAKNAKGRSRVAADALIEGVVNSISTLEERGFVSPYVCVFARDPFQTAHTFIGSSTSTPRDRIEPLIGRELLHASALDVPPHGSPDDGKTWRSRGVLLSLADGAVDLVIAATPSPEFRRVDERGRYVFVVYERFALRIKDPRAIVRLKFGV